MKARMGQDLRQQDLMRKHASQTGQHDRGRAKEVSQDYCKKAEYDI